MKKILLSTVAIVALAAGPAVAADMPVKARSAPPVAVASFSWTGCYIGGNVGFARNTIRLTDSVSFPGTFLDFGESSGTGFVGGGQIGCDYQINSIVIGARGMLDWANLDHRASMAPAAPTANRDTRMRSFTTATARLGWAVTPNALLYAVGGGAWTRTSVDVTLAGGVPSESASFSQRGWVFGGGVEFNLASNWTIFAEYNRLDFGTRRVCFTQAPGTAFTGIPCVGGGGNDMDVGQRVDVFMAGLNFRFSGIGPVSARY